MSALEGLVVILVNSILSVVLMFPNMQVDGDRRISQTGKFSLMHQAFLELTQFSNTTQLSEEDESTEVTEGDEQTEVAEGDKQM
jgi:competence protein ComGC